MEYAIGGAVILNFGSRFGRKDDLRELALGGCGLPFVDMAVVRGTLAMQCVVCRERIFEAWLRGWAYDLLLSATSAGKEGLI